MGRGGFDAVLVVAFGGPEGPDDVRPFLSNVLRGRRVSPDRIEEVARHYELFGGRSPLTAITKAQAEGLRVRLASGGIDLPVYLGMRNWHPFLADTLKAMSRDGVRRALGFICAAHRSYSSCTQYKQNVIDAREEVVRAGGRDVEMTWVGDWHMHDGFIEANVSHVRRALARLSAAVRPAARLVFTAHSIPMSMSGVARYQQQLDETAAVVASRAGIGDWALVYQSRSGRPGDPGLGPDIGEYLRAGRAAGLKAVVICPIGFLCDHIEVLYDLDHEAAAIARALDLPMVRAEAVNDDPLFLDAMAAVVGTAIDRYARGIPLPIVSATRPERAEGPPPAIRAAG
jgi:ferrochelatase